MTPFSQCAILVNPLRIAITQAAMILQKLPLELVQAILAEAMLARGLRRALRLRLVNSE